VVIFSRRAVEERNRGASGAEDERAPRHLFDKRGEGGDDSLFVLAFRNGSCQTPFIAACRFPPISRRKQTARTVLFGFTSTRSTHSSLGYQHRKALEPLEASRLSKNHARGLPHVRARLGPRSPVFDLFSVPTHIIGMFELKKDLFSAPVGVPMCAVHWLRSGRLATDRIVPMGHSIKLPSAAQRYSSPNFVLRI